MLPLNYNEICYLRSCQDGLSGLDSASFSSSHASENEDDNLSEFFGDFVFFGAATKACPIMLLSMQLAEARPLDEVIEWKG